MSIAALSVDMKLAQTQQDFGVALLKTAMEVQAEVATEELRELESLDPYLGQNLDILA